MDMTIYILATLRIALLLAHEPGPWRVFDRLREALGVKHDDVGQQYGTNVVSKGIICVWCNSLWVALGWLLIKLLRPRQVSSLAFPFAVSGGAVVINEVLEWLEQARRLS